MRIRSALLSACLPLAVSAATFVTAAGVPIVQPRSYTVQVDLHPEAGEIRARASVLLLRSDLTMSSIRFRLHEMFEIQTLVVNGKDATFEIQTVELERSRPASRLVTVEIPAAVREPYMRMELVYGGSLTPLPQHGTEEAASVGRALDDSVSTRRVELTYYSAWYPQFAEFGARFATDLAVTAPAGWIIVCTGEPVYTSTADGRVRSRWRASHANDLIILATPNFRLDRVDQGDAAVELYHTRLPRQFIDREARHAQKILEVFTDLLGEPSNVDETVRVVYSPRFHGQGGFSRPPMTVLSEGRVLKALQEDSSLSLLHGTAHEVAHFWWDFGAGQGDWINEAFAEYFALVAVARVDAPQQYELRLDEYSASVDGLPADAPSLAQVAATNAGYGHAIRYYKGSLMLAAIHRALGDDHFFASCREFHDARKGRPTSTEDFRTFWRARLGDHADIVDRWLNNPGGLPERRNTEHRPVPQDTRNER
jgi:aminopeptidase N